MCRDSSSTAVGAIVQWVSRRETPEDFFVAVVTVRGSISGKADAKSNERESPQGLVLLIGTTVDKKKKFLVRKGL